MKDVAERGEYRLYQYEWGTLRRTLGRTFGTTEEVYAHLDWIVEHYPESVKRWQFVLVQHFNTTTVGSRIRAIISFDENALMKVTTVE